MMWLIDFMLQHFLQGNIPNMLFDSEIEHIRHYIKNKKTMCQQKGLNSITQCVER